MTRLATTDLAAAPYAWITFRQDREEPVYIIIDTRVPNGAQELEAGAGESHILKPAAIVSAHREVREILPALEALQADFHGITPEQLRAERMRRLEERLARN